MHDLVFSTERLNIRRWRDADLAALMAVYGDSDAMRWVGDGKPISEAECRRWLDVTAENYRRRGYGMFAVELRAVPGVIGFCGIVHPGGQTEPELKYAYLRTVWGCGYATEAARGLIQYGAKAQGLRQLIATTSPENTASHRVLLKAGMTWGPLLNDDDGSLTQVFQWQADSSS